jgi:hypothetical protein
MEDWWPFGVHTRPVSRAVVIPGTRKHDRKPVGLPRQPLVSPGPESLRLRHTKIIYRGRVSSPRYSRNRVRPRPFNLCNIQGFVNLSEKLRVTQLAVISISGFRSYLYVR